MAEKNSAQTNKQTNRHYENNGHLAVNQYYNTIIVLSVIKIQKCLIDQFAFFNFGLIRFSISSTRFRFFDFGIRTPPRCKSILVCENTKTQWINLDEKFQLQYIDRPCRVWRSYSSHSAWSVCLLICHSSEPFNNSSADRHAIWVEDSGGPKESCIVIFGFSIRTLPQCRSILVCENTKTESIYFDGKFPSKYIGRQRWVWKSYSSVGVVNSFTLSMVSLSVDLLQLGRI